MAVRSLLNVVIKRTGIKLFTNDYTAGIGFAMGTFNKNIHTKRILKRKKKHPWNSDPSSPNYQWGSPASTDELDYVDTFCYKRDPVFMREWYAQRFVDILEIGMDALADPNKLERRLTYILVNERSFVLDGPDGFKDLPKLLEEHAYKVIQHVIKMKNLCENQQLELVRVLDTRYRYTGHRTYKYVVEVMQAGKMKTYLAKVAQHRWLDDALLVLVWCPYDPMLLGVSESSN